MTNEKERQQLRFLNAKCDAYFIGMVVSFEHVWRGWRSEPFFDPDIEEAVFRVTTDLRDGRRTVRIGVAESILHVLDDILEEILDQRRLMKKDHCRP